jgi:3-hydroxyisobutyrate dehydrogenase
MKTAVIGLGSMGWGAAISLLKAGFAVHGCDVRSDVLTRFTEADGDACTTPASAVDTADVVLIYVINSKQVEDVLFGQNGALETARPSTVFLLCTTMAPSATTAIAERLEAAGMQVIDAPVSGGHVRALAGEITVMASGPQEAFDRASARRRFPGENDQSASRRRAHCGNRRSHDACRQGGHRPEDAL